MKNTFDEINKIFGVNEAFFAPLAIMEILYDRERREKMFWELLDLHKKDLSFDWFHEYFQAEHADRKNKKQDFTPRSVASLLKHLIGTGHGSYYECACGTGGLVIEAWNQDRLQVMPWEYNPMNYYYHLEELSDRTVPFLLINIMIRGMNATVIHGDSLTRKAKGVFFVQNFENKPLNFSDLNVFPYNENSEKLFNVKFTERTYQEHVERSHADFLIGKEWME